MLPEQLSGTPRTPIGHLTFSLIHRIPANYAIAIGWARMGSKTSLARSASW